MQKSTERAGGGPGRSSGNTSGKSRTTGTSLMLGPLSFFSTMWARKAKVPLRKHLFALIHDISLRP
ncbi:hypothetical protein HanHA300_Chr13g0505001 [Helianthus annuus]|nr:hypothetical protein HanHA300_Chr13g0505001 [Helianthus annuus]KAJ0499704.1 hypothetical protein HanHA89_Chr13g0536901 [Helianthus annuus]